MIVPEKYTQLSALIDAQLREFPEHTGYLAKRFSDADENHLHLADDLAHMVLVIAGEQLAQICSDYRWLTQMVLDEEWEFRRTGRYRLSTFDDAVAQVYSNKAFMTRYMNGLLASQLWWRNHTEVLGFFRDRFVPGNAPGFSHLEVGPGHGLFLHLAATAKNCGSAQGWDISSASLDATQAAMHRLGAHANVTLLMVNLFEAPKAIFQSIAFSEVLEHLEDPLKALQILHGLLDDNGRIFINAPVNSPAPDHIYLFSAPEEIVGMVEAAGFDVCESHFSPASGATLAQARKRKLSISAAIIATKRR